MSSRTKIANNWLGSYKLMSDNNLPKNKDVLKHYMYLATFIHKKNTNGQIIREEVYNAIKAVYTRASIPEFSKSKQRILQQIDTLTSKRKEVNKRKSPDNIKEFKKTLDKIFPVVSLSDVPRPEKEFYQDQCLEKPIKTISQQIDKNQTRRNLKTFNTNNLQNQTDDTDQEDEEGAQGMPNVILSDSTSTSDTTDNDSDASVYEGPSTSTGTTAYFTQQLPGLGDSSAAAGISDDKLSRLFTEYEAAKGTGIIVMKKKIKGQREKSRNDKTDKLKGSTVFGKY